MMPGRGLDARLDRLEERLPEPGSTVPVELAPWLAALSADQREAVEVLCEAMARDGCRLTVEQPGSDQVIEAIREKLLAEIESHALLLEDQRPARGTR